MSISPADHDISLLWGRYAKAVLLCVQQPDEPAKQRVIRAFKEWIAAFAPDGAEEATQLLEHNLRAP